MATKEELEAREAECSSAADFAALAEEAVEVEADYAKALLEKAEMQCQLPPDYVAAAEAAVAAGLSDYAKDLYEQAEDACFEPMEFAALAAGYKALFDDTDKVAELMGQAADYAMSGEENLDLAKGSWELMGDKDFGRETLSRGGAWRRAPPSTSTWPRAPLPCLTTRTWPGPSSRRARSR